jgi:alcohol dehydrogenase
MYGFRSIDDPPGLWGGYADHQFLAADSLLFAIPAELDPVEATLFNPLGAGIRWAATLPGTKPGDVVAVLGPGIRGLCACASAKEAGAELVMVTGFGERDAGRLALAAEFGADLTVDVSVDDPIAALRAAGARGADIVVDVTAKAPSAFRQAIDLARPGGTIVLAGVRGEAVDGVNADLIVFKELRIMGALGVDASAYRSAIEMLRTPRYPFERLPRRVAGFDGIADLVETMAGERGEPPVHGVFVPGGPR